MAATIQVKEDTLAMLNCLKNEVNAKSYDEAIRYLFKKAKRMDKSHFRSLPKLESFQREEIDRFD